MSEVKVEIKADSSALATGLAKAQKNIQNFSKDVTTNISDKLAGAFSAAGVIGGIGVLAAGVMSAGRSIMDFAGNLQDASDSMGLTVEQLQGLHGAFMLGGASAEDVDKGIGKLIQSMDTATTSTGPVRDAFDKLGVSFDVISSGDTNAVLMAIADGIKSSKNPTEAYAAAMDLLGKSGKKMIASMRDGGDSLQATSDKVDKLSTKDTKSIADFGDAFDELKLKLMVQGAGAATPLFTELNDAMDNSKGVFSRFLSFVKAQSPAYWIYKTLGGGDTAAAEKAAADSRAAAPAVDDMVADAPIDPRISEEQEAAAKDIAERTKLSDEYAERKAAAAKKIADVETSNAEEIEKQRRDQLDTEGQINALLEDRKNLQSEIASSSGMQKAQAQKDLIAVEKDLATAKDKAKKDMAAEGVEREKNNAADLKKKDDAAKRKKDLVDANKQGAEELAAQKKSGEARQSSILDQMVDEEMKTPMQRANEDRVARERERIKGSLERRMKKSPPGQSIKMQQLAGELKDLTDKELPAEVAKLTEKLNEVVNKINKG
jgi:hypothetical protein